MNPSPPRSSSQLFQWNYEDFVAFEKAMSQVDQNSPTLFQDLAQKIPKKSVNEIRQCYNTLVQDTLRLSQIMDNHHSMAVNHGYQNHQEDDHPHNSMFSENASVNHHGDQEHQDYDQEDILEDTAGSSTQPEQAAGRLNRRKPWTPEEHQQFLIGLEKCGKGDWKAISRNYVPTKTPSQVSSHAQKYFMRQNNNIPINRRRYSIHDTKNIDPSILHPHDPQSSNQTVNQVPPPGSSSCSQTMQEYPLPFPDTLFDDILTSNPYLNPPAKNYNIHPELFNLAAAHGQVIDNATSTTVGGGAFRQDFVNFGAAHGHVIDNTASTTVGGDAFYSEFVNLPAAYGQVNDNAASTTVGGGAFHPEFVDLADAHGQAIDNVASTTVGGGAFHSEFLNLAAAHGQAIDNADSTTVGSGAFHPKIVNWVAAHDQVIDNAASTTVGGSTVFQPAAGQQEDDMLDDFLNESSVRQDFWDL